MRGIIATVTIGAACCLGCTGMPTLSDQAVASREIDRMVIFVRDWPDDYVEIALTRNVAGSTVVIYRPSQPGVPRLVLDSIGPSREDPAEVAELLTRFDVWAMADSNAAGAACSTKYGFWRCEPTFEDYSLVMGITRRGETRAQRYTGLRASTASKTARELGDFVFAMARKREG